MHRARVVRRDVILVKSPYREAGGPFRFGYRIGYASASSSGGCFTSPYKCSVPLNGQQMVPTRLDLEMMFSLSWHAIGCIVLLKHFPPQTHSSCMHDTHDIKLYLRACCSCICVLLTSMCGFTISSYLDDSVKIKYISLSCAVCC